MKFPSLKQLLEEHERLILALLCVVVFLFFALVTHWTPVSGDDWVYAVGGTWNSPFSETLLMYRTWSGRVLSELWGFLVAPHKGLWNLLNPLLFTLIGVLLVVLTEEKNHTVLSACFLFLMMLSVGNRVRMQTYTWIMGTTYVIPLFLFLIQVFLLKRWVIRNRLTKPAWILLCLLNFCIPLYMENAAALICGADVLVLIYLWWNDRRKVGKMAVLTVIAICGTLIILLSPGAAARLANDNAEFQALTLTQKILQNWPSFLSHMYTESRGVTTGFFLMSAGWAFAHRAHHKSLYLYILVTLFALVVHQGILYLFLTFWLIGNLIAMEEIKSERWFPVYLILCALGANLVMLVSPIFDSRSGLYSLYLLILVSGVMFQSVDCGNKIKRVTLYVGVLVLLGVRMVSYYDIYHMVHLINIRRNQQIEYYRVRPDAGDAWLLAYPDESIHSANVQEGDDTHMYYFKEYYYLSQDLHLVFYYLDDYNADTIFAPSE